MYIEDKFCNFENKCLINYPHRGVYNFTLNLAPTPGLECLRPEVIEFKLFLIII